MILLEYDAHNEYKIVNSLGNDSAPSLTLKDVKSGKNRLLYSSYKFVSILYVKLR